MRKLYAPSYRPEFDGLRGLCLLAVLTFHSFPEKLKGGYLAIDVFFVISGYLMTAIIVRSIENGTFTFREFYARRVLRIFPALVFVIPVTLVAGWMWLYPYELRLLFKHAAAGSFLLANWELLASLTEYFGTNAQYLPFLHLWSLSVEEQFYTFIPLFFWFLIRKRLPLVPSLFILALVTGLPFLHYKKTLPMLVYYATPFRLWEMAAGAILALTPALNRRRDHISFLGGFFIIGSFFLCANWQSFTGKFFAVTGTMLIMWGGTEAFFNRRILSLKFFVRLGIASYSIYLWHWPLLSLGRIIHGAPLTALMKLGLLAMAFVIGGASWKWIEAPARKSSRVWPWVTAMICIGAFSFFTYKRESLTGNVPFPPQEVGSPENVRDCSNDPLMKEIGNVNCSVSGTEEPQALIVGDSHAIDKFHGLALKDPSRHWGLLGMQNCSPVVGIEDKLNPSCLTGVEKLFQHVINMKSVQTVVLGFYGDFYYLSRIKTNLDQKEAFKKALWETVRLLTDSGKRIIVLIDVPEFQHYMFDCLRKKNSCEVPLENIWIGTKDHRPMMAELKKDFPQIEIFDPLPVFCDKDVCRFVKGSTPLYTDTVHVSNAGSELYAEYFLKTIRL